MSDEHLEEHEALVMHWITGAAASEDAQLKVRLERCPTCRQRLLELRGLVAGLSLAADEQEELLAAATDAVPGEEEALERWRRTLAANRTGSAAIGATARPRLSRVLARPPLLGLAASLLLALSLGAWWVVRAWRPVDELPVIELDASAFADATPHGAQATRVERFAWRESGIPSRAWQVEILAEAADDATPLLVSPRLIEPEWRPSAAEVAQLPARFRWRIVAEDSRGERRSSSAVAVTQPAGPDRGP